MDPISNLTLPFLNTMQQLFDPAPVLVRLVEYEDQLWGLADSQTAHQLMPNVAARRVQAFEALLYLVLVPRDCYQHASCLAIGTQLDLADADQSNARIAQFPFHQGDDFFPQSFCHAATVVFLSPVLHCLLFCDPKIEGNGEPGTEIPPWPHGRSSAGRNRRPGGRGIGRSSHWTGQRQRGPTGSRWQDSPRVDFSRGRRGRSRAKPQRLERGGRLHSASAGESSGYPASPGVDLRTRPRGSIRGQDRRTVASHS